MPFAFQRPLKTLLAGETRRVDATSPPAISACGPNYQDLTNRGGLRLLQTNNQLEDHDQYEDRDADVHVEGLAAHGDVLRVLRFLADAGRRLIHITLQLVEEAQLLSGFVVHRLAQVADAVDAGAQALALRVLGREALAGRHGCCALVRRAGTAAAGTLPGSSAPMW